MVQGVALELLCRLLFTEGSNPSLSVPSPNSPTSLTVTNQPRGRSFFLSLYISYLYLYIDYLYIDIYRFSISNISNLIAAICKIISNLIAAICKIME